MNYSDMVEINVEVEALNLDGIKQNLLDYVQKEAKISIEESVEKADKSAKDAESAANIAEDAAISATDCARQASESFGLYYTKEQSDTLLSSKQDTITGAATTITDNNLTANRALTSNSNGKVDVATTTTTELNYVHGVTSAIQTQLNAKASTALDNLSSAGQMIIDSANGTISNCILEIPQNIKMTLENNVLTLKAGSVLTLTGSTYATATTTQDKTISYSYFTEGDNYMIFASSTGALQGLINVSYVFSGDTQPVGVPTNSVFFNTNDKLIYIYQNNQWNLWGVCYPICILRASGGVLSFAKDRKGRDIIFNSVGFIGHHAFIYPNVKALLPDKFNDDRSLKSTLYTTNSLMISDLGNTGDRSIAFPLVGAYMSGETGWGSYEELPTTHQEAWAYVTKENLFYRWSSSTSKYDLFNNGKGTYFIDAHVTNGVVTSFNVRQPYDGARYLLTDDLYKQIGDVETLLATV